MERYESYTWDELPRAAKGAATTLGYNQKLWNNDARPMASNKNWKDLTVDQKGAAIILGYGQDSWTTDEGGDDESADQLFSDDDIIPDESLGMYNDCTWNELPFVAKSAAMQLGYDKGTWDDGGDPSAFYNPWSALSARLKAAAQALGYGEQSWNDRYLLLGVKRPVEEKAAAVAPKAAAKAGPEAAAICTKMDGEARTAGKIPAGIKTRSHTFTMETYGWDLRRVVDCAKLAMLQQMLRIDDAYKYELGRGRDAHKYDRPYSRLELHAAWHFDMEDRREIYAIQRRLVSRECARVGTVPELHTKLDFVHNHFDVDTAINEKWLLHGTQPKLVLPTLDSGLNEHLASLQGMFGAGIYLAEDAAKIDQYATPDTGSDPDLRELHKKLFWRDNTMHPGTDLFYVFVVSAICGVSCRTLDGKMDRHTEQPLFASECRRELAFIPENQPLRYHSLLADTGDKLQRFREFVFYHAARTNIAYLIAYRRQ